MITIKIPDKEYDIKKLIENEELNDVLISILEDKNNLILDPNLYYQYWGMNYDNVPELSKVLLTRRVNYSIRVFYHNILVSVELFEGFLLTPERIDFSIKESVRHIAYKFLTEFINCVYSRATTTARRQITNICQSEMYESSPLHISLRDILMGVPFIQIQVVMDNYPVNAIRMIFDNKNNKQR